MRSKNVDTEDITELLIRDNLDESICFAHTQSLTARCVRESPNLDRIALFLGLRLRHTASGDFGDRENTPRYCAVIHLRFSTHAVLRSDNSFRRCNVCQQIPARDIPDGVNTRHIGLHPFINYNFALIRPDTDRFQSNTFRVETPADRN